MAASTGLGFPEATEKASVSSTKSTVMNHRKWKAFLKKMKRKEKRQQLAKERDSLLELEGGVEDEALPDSEEERKLQEEEAERLRQNELWLERERQAQLQFQAKKEWEEKERKRKEEIEKKIKEEWEERERREREEQERNEKKEAEKRSKQDKLLKEATANENTGAWHNPIGPVQYSEERKIDPCPFFKKTAACRFGDQCSRLHEYPEVSCTILIPGMFTSFELEQSVVDSVDTDISLEYDEEELYQSFKEFYSDVVPEFKKLGTIVQFKVCCNCEPHLRGNVYVQFKRESVAQAAYHKFNARWYGGKQLNCIFVSIDSWKSAICGLAFRKRCPKGKSCNFLHVFQNPGREFTEMDQDQLSGKADRLAGGRSYRNEERHWHGHHRRGSRSPSHHRRRNHKSRSPRSPSRSSPDKDKRYKSRRRSRSIERYRSKDKHRHTKSRSYSRAHSRSRSQSPHPYLSPSRSRSQERYSRSRTKKSRSSHNKSRSPHRSPHSQCYNSNSSCSSSSPSSPALSVSNYRKRPLSRSPTSRSKRQSKEEYQYKGKYHKSRSSSESPERPVEDKSERSHRKSKKRGDCYKHKRSTSKKSDSSKHKDNTNSNGWASSSDDQYEYLEVTKEALTPVI